MLNGVKSIDQFAQTQGSSIEEASLRFSPPPQQRISQPIWKTAARNLKTAVNLPDEAEFPLLAAKNFNDLNHFRGHHQYYLELPNNHFVAYRDVYSPSLRALALAQLMQPQDILIGVSALWLHTGFVADTMSELSLARIDGRKRNGIVRKKIPSNHLMQVENVAATTPSRTALDLLLQDLELGITALPKLIRVGSDILQIQQIALQMTGVPGINRVRSVLRQLREVPSLCAPHISHNADAPNNILTNQPTTAHP